MLAPLSGNCKCWIVNLEDVMIGSYKSIVLSGWLRIQERIDNRYPIAKMILSKFSTMLRSLNSMILPLLAGEMDGMGGRMIAYSSYERRMGMWYLIQRKGSFVWQNYDGLS